MRNLSELQNRYHFIIDIEYLEFKSKLSFNYEKYVLTLKNDMKLFVTEFISQSERKYSFHLQNRENELIQRWDNSPHHPKIDTFPHHTHVGKEVLPLTAISFDDIMKVILEKYFQTEL